MIASILTHVGICIAGAVFYGFWGLQRTSPKLFSLFVMECGSPAAAILNEVQEKDLDVKAAMLCGNPRAFILSNRPA